MAISKIILNGVTQMDVTQDTVASNNLLSGETATGADGNQVVGAYVPSSPTIESLSVTPSETQQTYNSPLVDGYKPVTVGAISSTYVGSGITRRSSSDMTASGATVTAPAGYYASAASKTIPNASPGVFLDTYYVTENGVKKWIAVASGYEEDGGWINDGSLGTDEKSFSIVPANTTVTPSTSSQTIGGANYMMEGAVTVAAMPSGTAGTPTATKGTVSNHSVAVTPSVTNSAGYITGGTKNGTGVSVSASELVSGSQTITQNGTVDVTNLASVVVAVEGGGGSGVQVETGVEGARTSTSSISFTGLKGQPNAFYAMVDDSVAASATATVVAFVYDGQTLHAQTLANQITYDDSSLSYTYNNGTLTITSNGATIAGGVFYLSYAYGGTSGNIDTKDAQVGSGATSITFTGLDDEPIAWSCIFKSNFSTSSGYQRVVYVDYENGDIYGTEMDSGTHNASHWTASYSNGSLTITSNGTNQGGYFHQPGYYQLTAVYGGEIEPTEIEVEPLSVTQNGTYTAPTGKAYSPVTVNVSGGTINVATTTWTNSDSTATTHTFTSLSGTPKAAFLRCTSSLSRSSSSSNYFIADMRWTGSATAGNSFRRSNGTYANVTSGYSFSASGTSLTVTTSGNSTTNPGSFYNGTYELTYVY